VNLAFLLGMEAERRYPTGFAFIFLLVWIETTTVALPVGVILEMITRQKREKEKARILIDAVFAITWFIAAVMTFFRPGLFL